MHLLLGNSALSAFRRDKLLGQLKGQVSGVTSVEGRFVYFVEVEGALSDAGARRLEVLLEGAFFDSGEVDSDNTIIVAPRVGTRSPWGSKALDILQHCDLSGVKGVERAP